MVTGDHPLTAAAIARKIGLITSKTREEVMREQGVLAEDVDEDDVGQCTQTTTAAAAAALLRQTTIVLRLMMCVTYINMKGLLLCTADR